MIITGGKYCAEAGTGAAQAISVSAAARPTTFGFSDAFLGCNLFAARRDLQERQPAENPIWSALANSPVRAVRCASDCHHGAYTAIGRANSSAPLHGDARVPLVVVNPKACSERSDRSPRQLPCACGARKREATGSVASS